MALCPRHQMLRELFLRKDASRSLNREGANRAWVFEVKYFKYTLFTLILPRALRSDARDTVLRESFVP
jgi:hypothetical protein